MQTTIIDHLTQPIIIARPSGTSNTKTITYVYSDAFTTCDCGEDLMLSQRVYGNATYKGSCSCGREWELLNGKIRSL